MQTRQTFATRYYCRECKKNKQGVSPIELSIIVNGERVFISLPRKMQPKDFSKATASRASNETKLFLSLYDTKVNNAVTEIVTRNEVVTAQRVKDYITGNVCHCYTLKKAIYSHLELLSERTKKEITLDCYRRYEVTYEDLLKALGNKDISAITAGDMLAYRTRVLNSHQASTAYGYMARVKSLFKHCVDNGWLTVNPMASIKTPKGEKKIEILTDEEYIKIRDKRFDIPRLEKVRQLFVLGCNCGLAYADLMLLTSSDIMEKDGIKFISKERKKTGVKFTAVILEDGIDILSDIDSLKMSNQKLNSYLKEIEDLCGIKHHLTMHKSRHYYITRLVRKGINPEIIRQCAGHSKLSMTQKYLHIVSDDVINAFKGS